MFAQVLMSITYILYLKMLVVSILPWSSVKFLQEEMFSFLHKLQLAKFSAS